MKNKYLVVKHYLVPGKNARTEAKEYGKTGEKMVDERISFSNNIKKNDLLEATFILDLEAVDVVKNRFKDSADNESTDVDIIRYYLKEYRNEIIEALPKFKFEDASAED